MLQLLAATEQALAAILDILSLTGLSALACMPSEPQDAHVVLLTRACLLVMRRSTNLLQRLAGVRLLTFDVVGSGCVGVGDLHS